MVETITKYKAYDGTLWATLEAACLHEANQKVRDHKMDQICGLQDIFDTGRELGYFYDLNYSVWYEEVTNFIHEKYDDIKEVMERKDET